MKPIVPFLIIAVLVLVSCGQIQPGTVLPPQQIQGATSNPRLGIASIINDGLAVTKCSEDEYGYATIAGTLRNNTSVPLVFVQLKVMLVKNGSVVDTDSVYAVGNEGLGPGEQTTWEWMFSNAPSFTQCSAKLLDFDVR